MSGMRTMSNAGGYSHSHFSQQQAPGRHCQCRGIMKESKDIKCMSVCTYLSYRAHARPCLQLGSQA